MQRECYSFHLHIAIENLSVSLDSGRGAFLAFAFLTRYHSTVHNLAKNIKTHTNVFLDHTVLFTSLKIILLQYFQ